MARFPLDPRFTKVILASVEHKCLEEALTVIALLSGESVFIDSAAKRVQAVKTRQRYGICLLSVVSRCYYYFLKYYTIVGLYTYSLMY